MGNARYLFCAFVVFIHGTIFWNDMDLHVSVEGAWTCVTAIVEAAVDQIIHQFYFFS